MSHKSSPSAPLSSLQRRRLLQSLGALGMAGLPGLAAAQTPPTAKVNTTKLAITDTEVTVGQLHSATGTMAISETGSIQAEQLAIDQINAMGGILGGVIGAAMYGVWMIIAGVAFFGALKMKDLKSYPFAMTSAILALLPCTFYICCILGLPFGIWALIVLMKPEVKAEFR